MGLIRIELNAYADKEKAKVLQGFFKTGVGQYGEGDFFLGVVVPKQRIIVKKIKDSVGFEELKESLKSRIHEERLVVLLILVEKYKKADVEGKKAVFDFYIKNLTGINNWDLVDLSAPNIVGDYLLKKDSALLYKLAKSENIWERRIAIVSTFTFIRAGLFDDALKISDILLSDSHDLIHKAVGWMLREVGKKNEKVLKEFLRTRYKRMPRTMLRYAIERFDEEERKRWLTSKI